MKKNQAPKTPKTPDKGTYRSIYSAIWDDPEFRGFDADMQLLFVVLRTCKDCSFYGIYVLYLENLHGRICSLTPERIDAAFDRLVEAGWVRYELPILWIVKALKNEPSFSPDNPLHVRGAQNYLGTLAKLNIVREFATYYNIPYPSDTLSIPPRKGIDTPSARYPLHTPSNQGEGEGDDKSTSTPGAALTAAPSDQHPEKTTEKPVYVDTCGIPLKRLS